ncbi:hypothetical protein ANN_24336 [Periplaneta americana]|uniref:Uncharacterized protein n=1 Tax=Periplaneta americana TaxID=6978 RepID=A0ABQ8S342_PERAM|nr:hypothetical protein ANN_24336 [Periplaneta americana]
MEMLMPGQPLVQSYAKIFDSWLILQLFIAYAVLMDMRSEVANQPDFDLLPQHISDWEEEHGEIPDDSVVLIRYGWGIYYNNRTRYFGFEKHGRNMHFPGLSRELATRGTLVGVGTDTPSVDAGKSVTYRAHVHLQTTNMYVLENLDLEHDNMPGFNHGSLCFLSRFAAVLMDMRSEVANQPDFELLPQHISDWEEEHGEIPDDSVLLIRYGWGIYYNNRTRYFGFEKHGRNMHFPGLSEGAARELATRGTLVGVGTDTPSVDAGKSVTYRAHVHLQTANMYVLENLDLEHDNMPERDFTLWVMPMKIAEGTGAPCRVIAVLNFSPSVETSFSLILSALALIRTLQYLQ